MNDDAFAPPPDDEPRTDTSPRSPVRPTPPPAEPLPESRTAQPTTAPPPEAQRSDPRSALTQLRQKMEQVATEYAQGKINRAQFNAMYGRYGEQRAIIEKLIERNPDSKAWKQVVGSAGHTSFLRQHFEAHPLYFVVFRHKVGNPLMVGGKTTPNVAQIAPLLKSLWAMPQRPKAGMARKPMPDNHWLILAVGEFAVTLVMFLLEPSVAQVSLVRDLHADFERANRSALDRQEMPVERMVFPQRALVEGNL